MRPSPRPGCHVFCDESKDGDYLLVAAAVVPVGLATVRSKVRQLRHAGSPTVHMRKESDSQRKHVLAQLVDQGHHGVIYRARRRGGASELELRQLCLEALVDDCADMAASRLVLEEDKSLLVHDRRFLAGQVRRRGMRADFQYSFDRASHEPLLWVPDAIAWAYARGGDFKRRVEPMIDDVRVIAP